MEDENEDGGPRRKRGGSNLNHEVTLTLFANGKDNGSGSEEALTLAQVRRIVENGRPRRGRRPFKSTNPDERVRRREDKIHLPMLMCKRLGRKVNPDSGGLRWANNVVAWTGLEIDYDAGDISFEDAVGRFEKHRILALVHTTPSNTGEAGGHRWRAICPFFEEKSDHKASTALFQRLNVIFDGTLAPESDDPSRGFFAGRRFYDEPVVSAVVDGQFVDRAVTLPAAPLKSVAEDSTSHYEREVEEEDRTFRALEFHEREGEKFEDALWHLPEEFFTTNSANTNGTGKPGWVDMVACVAGEYHGHELGLDLLKRVTKEKCGDTYDERELVAAYKRMSANRKQKTRGAASVYWHAEKETDGEWTQKKFDQKQSDRAFEDVLREVEEKRVPAPKNDFSHVFEDIDEVPPVAKEGDDELPLFRSQSFDVFTPAVNARDENLLVTHEVIEGLISPFEVMAIIAPSRVGKTQHLQHMEECVALGRRYHGLRSERGTVLSFVGENIQGSRRRRRAMDERNGVQAPVVQIGLRKSPLAMEEGEIKELYRLVGFYRPKMVSFDTLNAVFKIDDKDEESVNRVVEFLRNVARLTNKGFVVVVHHPPKEVLKLMASKEEEDKRYGDYSGKGSVNLFSAMDVSMGFYEHDGTIRVAASATGRKVKENSDRVMDAIVGHREVIEWGYNQYGKRRTIAIYVEGPGTGGLSGPVFEEGLDRLNEDRNEAENPNYQRAAERRKRIFDRLCEVFGEGDFSTDRALEAIRNLFKKREVVDPNFGRQRRRDLAVLESEYGLLALVSDDKGKSRVYRVKQDTVNDEQY